MKHTDAFAWPLPSPQRYLAISKKPEFLTVLTLDNPDGADSLQLIPTCRWSCVVNPSPSEG